MTLKQETIDQVQTTWNALVPDAQLAARLFYENLFSAAPGLRSLFRGDMEDQGRKLMKMIGVAVGMLDTPHALVPALEALGRRHQGYGVREEHYQVVGEALIATLAMGLGERFTPAVQEAWTTVYGLIAETMQRGAQSERVASPAATRKARLTVGEAVPVRVAST